MTSKMEGLASLALAMAHLEKVQEQSGRKALPVHSTAATSNAKPEPEPPQRGHSWDTAISPPLPTAKPTYDQASRVVSADSQSPCQQPMNAGTATTAPKSNTISPAEQQESITSDDDQAPTPPPPDEVISAVGENDVLCGRGGETNNHVGNIKYRDLVKQYQRQYLKAKRREKPRIARLIVDTIRRRNGRFLKKHVSDNTWRDVGNTKAREKTSQALREGAPELREDKTVYSSKQHRSKKFQKFVPVSNQVYKRKASPPAHLLVGSISPNANLVSPTPSSAVFQQHSFVLYPTAVSADSDDTPSMMPPVNKKVKRGPRLAILKARLQDE